jgi:hypothetical protein
MPAHLCHRLCLAFGLMGAVVFTWSLPAPPWRVVSAQENGAKKDLTTAKFYGVSTCIKCHTELGTGYNQQLAYLNEYTTWRQKDRHALAFAVLEGPRGQRMAKILNFDVTKDARCLNCHATTYRPDRQGKDFSLRDGVSCDGCHGPAEHWLLDHAFKEETWRALTPEAKEALGMFNVRDPVKRAELCMSCHVGNALEGKVVSHEMYAAGHPPLPAIEVAGFSLNLPKHWMDLKDIPFLKKADDKLQKAYHFHNAEFQQTKQVLASGVVGVRNLMTLVALRARPESTAPSGPATPSWPPPWLRPLSKGEPKDRWPELVGLFDQKIGPALQERWPEIAMAQSDCSGCHHDLKSKSWRQVRGYAGRPGRPQLQSWPFALAGLVVADETVATDLTSSLKKLQMALDAQPFGDPSAVSAAADGLHKCSLRFRNPSQDVDRQLALSLLKRLTTFTTDDFRDYDSARQIAWAFLMIYGDLVPESKQPQEVTKILEALDDELSLTLNSPARKKSVEDRRALTGKLVGKDSQPLKVLADRQGFLDPLQAVLDQELAAVLERAARYDPVLFKQRMQALGKLLP